MCGFTCIIEKSSNCIKDYSNTIHKMLEEISHRGPDEQKISIEQVSRGTIEQIYFALRMAASEILYEEEYPVVLDDTFVFYDDVRLENTLRWLEKNKKQVLIFTCQKREERMLSEM